MPNFLRKLARLYHTLKHVPLPRYLDRLSARAKRSSLRQSPAKAFARLSRVAEQAESLTALKRLNDAARLWLDFTSGELKSCDLRSPIELSVTIHGETRAVIIDKPYLPPQPPGCSRLWAMSLGYMPYLASGLGAGELRYADAMQRMAGGWTSPEAWQQADIFDHQWHPYAVSHRLITLTLGLCLYRQAGGTASPQMVHEVSWMAALHAAFLKEHLERDLQFNHLSKNLVAIAIYEASTGGQISPQTSRELISSIESQVLPDGGHAELCPMYHNAYLADLMILGQLDQQILGSELGAMLPKLVPRMQAAAEAVSFTSGQIATFGDSWLGEAPSTCQLIKSTTKSPAGVRVLKDMGYVKLAQGVTEVIIDVGHGGPDANPAHAHDDFLSLEVAFGGRKVIVDYGVETYENNEGRRRTRSNSSHNGPRVQGLIGLDCWHSFRVGRRARRPTYQVAQQAEGCEMTARFTPLDGGKLGLQRRVAIDTHGNLLLVDQWRDVPAGAIPELSFLLPCTAWVAPQGHEGRLQSQHNPGWYLDWNCRGALSTTDFFPEYGQPSLAYRLTITPRAVADGFESMLALTRSEQAVSWPELKQLLLSSQP